MAYTLSYLVVTLLANYKLVMKRAVTGNFGTEGNVYNDYAEVVHLEAKADAEITFPTDFVGFFAVYYSVAHVCSVCRALEQKPPKAWLVRGTLGGPLVPLFFGSSFPYKVANPQKGALINFL